MFECHYCKKTLPIEKRTKDHKIPRRLGYGLLLPDGTKNWVWACKKCNQDKGEIPYDLYVERKRPRPLGIRKPDGTFLTTKRNGS